MKFVSNIQILFPNTLQNTEIIVKRTKDILFFIFNFDGNKGIDNSWRPWKLQASFHWYEPKHVKRKKPKKKSRKLKFNHFKN